MTYQPIIETLDTIFHMYFGTLLLFSLGLVSMAPFVAKNDVEFYIGIAWYMSGFYVGIRQFYWKFIE